MHNDEKGYGRSLGFIGCEYYEETTLSILIKWGHERRN
jgi:hypothetical protein